jgi:feruloyl esterase
MGSQADLRRFSSLSRRLRFSILAASPLALAGLALPASRIEPADLCGSLRLLSTGELGIVHAAPVSAAKFPAGDGPERAVTQFCRVIGVARPTPRSEIRFELWLPVHWNGRYVQLGNGGFAGNIDNPSLAAEIERGNAVAMSDTGHQGNQFDASWALDRPERVVDYGHRSIKATSDAADRLIRAYYGRIARRRYFVGCSNGGRQALMAIQRYPDDWDGVLAGAPALQWTRQLATFAAIQHRLRQAPANWIPVAKLPAIQRAAIASCPPANVSKGVALDPRLCRFDSYRLLCRGAETPECLTPAQAASLDLIRFGPRAGEPLYHGFEATSAAIPGNWGHWILDPDRDARSQLALATQAYRYLILDQPDWQVEKFDSYRDFMLARDREVAGQHLSGVLDADDTDLTRFARKGGKIIMYFGWSDALISPAAGLSYYQRVTARMGGIVQTKSFFRLFMVPGMQHCQGGIGPDSFGQAIVAPPLRRDARHDVRRALERWVEKGEGPDALVAVKYGSERSGTIAVATQELRSHPQTAGIIISR